MTRSVVGVVNEAEAAVADWAETVAEYSAGRLDDEVLSKRRTMYAAQVALFTNAVTVARPVSSTSWSEMGIPERRRAWLRRFQDIEIAPAHHSGRFDPTRIRAIPHT